MKESKCEFCMIECPKAKYAKEKLENISKDLLSLTEVAEAEKQRLCEDADHLEDLLKEAEARAEKAERKLAEASEAALKVEHMIEENIILYTKEEIEKAKTIRFLFPSAYELCKYEGKGIAICQKDKRIALIDDDLFFPSLPKGKSDTLENIIKEDK